MQPPQLENTFRGVSEGSWHTEFCYGGLNVVDSLLKGCWEERPMEQVLPLGTEKASSVWGKETGAVSGKIQELHLRGFVWW